MLMSGLVKDLTWLNSAVFSFFGCVFRPGFFRSCFVKVRTVSDQRENDREVLMFSHCIMVSEREFHSTEAQLFCSRITYWLLKSRF